MTLTNSQRNRREKHAAMRREAVDALVSRLMLRLPQRGDMEA